MGGMIRSRPNAMTAEKGRSWKWNLTLQQPPRLGGTRGKASPQVSGLRDWVDGGPRRGVKRAGEGACEVPAEPQNVKLHVPVGPGSDPGSLSSLGSTSGLTHTHTSSLRGSIVFLPLGRGGSNQERQVGVCGAVARPSCEQPCANGGV